MSRPLLSIAIPNFNYGRYLCQALASATGQEGEDIEILVADNHSTDNSYEKILSISDHRVRAWRHDRNIGLYPNWNFLLNQARGKYFKILQSDDWLDADFSKELRSTLKNAAADNVSAILFGYRISFESPGSPQSISSSRFPSAECVPEVFTPQKNFSATLCSLGYSMPTLNLVNTELAIRVGGYKPENSMRADSILFSRILAEEPTWSVLACNASVVVTRVHGANDRKRYSRFAPFRDEIVFLRELQSLAKSNDESRVLEGLISRAAGQAMISLPLDIVRRCNRQEFALHLKEIVDLKVLPRACAALPAEALKILRGCFR